MRLNRSERSRCVSNSPIGAIALQFQLPDVCRVTLTQTILIEKELSWVNSSDYFARTEKENTSRSFITNTCKNTRSHSQLELGRLNQFNGQKLPRHKQRLPSSALWVTSLVKQCLLLIAQSTSRKCSQCVQQESRSNKQICWRSVVIRKPGRGTQVAGFIAKFLPRCRGRLWLQLESTVVVHWRRARRPGFPRWKCFELRVCHWCAAVPVTSRPASTSSP